MLVAIKCGNYIVGYSNSLIFSLKKVRLAGAIGIYFGSTATATLKAATTAAAAATTCNKHQQVIRLNVARNGQNKFEEKIILNASAEEFESVLLNVNFFLFRLPLACNNSIKFKMSTAGRQKREKISEIMHKWLLKPTKCLTKFCFRFALLWSRSPRVSTWWIKREICKTLLLWTFWKMIEKPKKPKLQRWQQLPAERQWQRNKSCPIDVKLLLNKSKREFSARPYIISNSPHHTALITF